MAHPNSAARVLIRDGFRCRYCAAKLYSAQAVKLLDAEAPDLQLWDRNGKREPLRHWWATVDHVDSLASGGTDCMANLVACCVRCNSSSGARHKVVPPPSSDIGWHGYASCFLALAPKHAKVLSTKDQEWLRALQWAGVSSDHALVAVAIAHLRSLKVMCAAEVGAEKTQITGCLESRSCGVAMLSSPLGLLTHPQHLPTDSPPDHR